VNFAFDEDQDLLRSTTRRYLDDKHPLRSLRGIIETDETVDRSAWQAGAALGWAAMLIPPTHDGGSVTDQPLVDLVVVGEELGRVLHPAPLLPVNVVADALARSGTETARRRYLGALARGQLLAAWCFTADGSAELTSVAVDAVPEGDGYRLDGVARYVEAGSVADLLLVSATVAGDLVQVLVPRESPGISVRQMVGIDLTRRYAEVTFENTPAESSLVLAGPGSEAGALTERALAIAAVLQGSQSVGSAGQLLDATVTYTKDRVQFGRPIGSFQAIKHRLADLHIAVEAMRAAVHYAALAVDGELADSAEAVSVVGSYAKDAFAFLAGECLQIHGGIGFTWEHDVHLFLRRAKTDQVLYGEPSWHRERLCRLLEQTALAEAI